MEQTSTRTKVRHRWITVALISVVMVIWVSTGCWPNSNFTLERLQGLTPEHVIDRLGVPKVDERLPAFGGWTPAKEADAGPLQFYYYGSGWRGFEYAIIFKNGRVSDVKIGAK